MAIGTALLAATVGGLGFTANIAQNDAVREAMHHAFSTIPGFLWIATAIVLLFYQINKKSYNKIVEELTVKKQLENTVS